MHAEGNEDGTYQLRWTPEVMLHCEDDGLLVTTMTACAGAAGCEPAWRSAWNVQACCICLLQGKLLRMCFNLSLMLMMHVVMATLIPWVLGDFFMKCALQIRTNSNWLQLSKDCLDALSWHCSPQSLVGCQERSYSCRINWLNITRTGRASLFRSFGLKDILCWVLDNQKDVFLWQ